GVEEKAQGNGAVIDVTVGLDLNPAEHAVVRTQLIFAAVRLDGTVGAVRGNQGLECLGVCDHPRGLVRAGPPPAASGGEGGRRVSFSSVGPEARAARSMLIASIRSELQFVEVFRRQGSTACYGFGILGRSIPTCRL